MSYLGKAELKASKIKRWTGVPVSVDSIPYDTIGFIPYNEASTFVTVNGIKQHDSAYLLSTTNARMEFSSSLNETDEVEIVCIFDVGVPTYIDVIENTIDVAALNCFDGADGDVLITDGSGTLAFSSALAESIEEVEILAIISL